MAVSGHHSQSHTASSTLNGAPREMCYVKGSIDAVLQRCMFYYVSDESTPGLDAATRNMINSRALSIAARGLRVVAMAYGYGSLHDSSLGSSTNATALTHSRKSSPSSMPPSRSSSPSRGGRDADRTNLVFVGFQAMFDPPRKGVADAIDRLQAGGVQVIMITGDAEETALSIAKDLGLRVGGGAGSRSYCLTGKAIDQMNKAQLREKVSSISVFARTTPRHKMAIIEALQAGGAVVAMTGDGGKQLSFCFFPFPSLD